MAKMSGTEGGPMVEGCSFTSEPSYGFVVVSGSGPDVRRLVKAALELAKHDAFDPEYLSSDLNNKLSELRSAIEAVTGEWL